MGGKIFKRRIIMNNIVVLKTEDDKEVFIDAILNPAKPNAKLKRALKNYNKFIKTNKIKLNN